MTSRFSGVLIKKVIFGVEIDGNIKVELELKTGKAVIIVSVCEKNG